MSKKAQHSGFAKFILFFVARPFVGALRYGVLKIMKRLRTPNDNRPSLALSEYFLQKMILPAAFHTFQDSHFRAIVAFQQLPVSERDRIFNELEVSGVCFAMSYLATVKQIVRLEDFHLWRVAGENLPNKLQEIFAGYGITEKNTALFRQLIEMRRDEYSRLAARVLEMDEHENGPTKDCSPEVRQIAADMQAIALGTADHVRRGTLQDHDPLVPYCRKWLLGLQKDISRFVARL